MKEATYFSILLDSSTDFSLYRSEDFCSKIRKSWGKWSTNKGACFTTHCTGKGPDKLLILFSMSFMQMTWTWWCAEVKLTTMLAQYQESILQHSAE